MLRVPVLVTDRLVLRAHESGDLERSAAMWADPVVVRHIGNQPFSRQEVWSRLLRYVGHWAVLGYGYWAVTSRDDGHLLGELGFADFKRSIEPSIEGVPELGFALMREAHGKGFATEALRAVVAWGDERFARTVAIVNPDNVVSQRVLDKLGYRDTHRTTYGGEAVRMFARPRR